MKYQISILIPARNEMWLSRTVQDILEHKEGATEIIVGLDGQWADPPLPIHKDVSVVYYNKSLGQRALTNQLAKISQAKYVIKVDAHCKFDQGFDVKMWQAFKETGDNVAMFPIMKNLHIFDWVCKNGHRRYQGPSGPCKECGEPTEMDVLWREKPSPNSTAFCFDSEPHFQYDSRWKKMQEEKGGDLTESMSLQGSFFMCTREKYWELNLGDESFGSWGSQGIQTACSFWLSGGRVICNHRTWYAHLFRTQGSDFSFPYPQSNTKVQAAKALAKNKLYENNWPHQIHPSSWLIERFSPPGWSPEAVKDLKENEKPLNNH